MNAKLEIRATSAAGSLGAEAASDLAREVIALLATEMNIDPSTICAETTLEDLGVQSIDFVDMLFAIESHFGVELPNLASDDRPLNTVDDVTNIVRESLASAAGT